jgi:phage terminase Nu1 subunit (DNA packaging protein)
MNRNLTNIELAEYFGISRQSISMLVARGVISKDAGGLFNLKACTQSYTAHLRDMASGRAHEVSETKMQSLRAGVGLKEIQTQLAQVKLDKETKATVDRADVVESMHRLALNVKHFVLLMPIKIKGALGLSVDAEETINVICHDCLNQLANGIMTLQEGIGFCDKSPDELTEADLVEMSPYEFKHRWEEPDFRTATLRIFREADERAVSELIREAELAAIAATPIPREAQC